MNPDILKISFVFYGDLGFQNKSICLFCVSILEMENRTSYFRVTLIKVSKNSLFASNFSARSLYYI